jgi:hypothetical protein
MTEQSNGATWRVESQTPRTRADSTGNVADGFDIAFQTGDGHTGTVFVPQSRYTADNVRAIIQAQANLMDEVGSLTSGG